MKTATKIVLFVIAFSLFGAGWYARDLNSQESSRMVQAIITDDLAGHDVSEQIKAVQEYSGKHMNATIDFVLQGTYNRASDAYRAYRDSVAAAQQANSQIYAEAQKACAGKGDSVKQAACNQEYLSTHLRDIKAPEPVPEPKEKDYYYRFISPVWTADIAGALFFDAVATLIFAIIVAVAWRNKY